MTIRNLVQVYVTNVYFITKHYNISICCRIAVGSLHLAEGFAPLITRRDLFFIMVKLDIMTYTCLCVNVVIVPMSL